MSADVKKKKPYKEGEQDLKVVIIVDNNYLQDLLMFSVIYQSLWCTHLSPLECELGYVMNCPLRIRLSYVTERILQM